MRGATFGATMNTFFLTCAAVGGVILVAQLVLSFFGAEHHADDPHSGSHHDGASEGLQLFSARSLSAALAFFGIGALAISAMRLPAPVAIVGGGVLGVAAMTGVAMLMRAMLKLDHDGSINIERAIGASATVYVPIPASEQGSGKVTLTLQGRTVEYQAVTAEGQQLPTGSAVLIVEVRSADTVEVVPLPSLDGVL